MSSANILYREIYATFAVQPVPKDALRSSSNFWRDSDIWCSVKQWIVGKTWDSLKLRDWAMIGTTPGIARYYLTADAFHYYIPSILSNVCETGQYPEFAIDALTSPDFSNKTVGTELEIWWAVFTKQFTYAEKLCVSNFVDYIKCRDDLSDDERSGLNFAWWLR